MTQGLYFRHSVSVADVAALQAIVPEDRYDGSLRVVIDPGNNLSFCWYQFKENSTFPELIPAIVNPFVGSGQWIMSGTLVYFGSNDPDIIPPLTNIQWIFDNKIWQSVNIQSVSDWIEITATNTGSENRLLVSQEGVSSAPATALVFGQAFNVNSEGSVFYINIP
jgi:hypothetical protein